MTDGYSMKITGTNLNVLIIAILKNRKISITKCVNTVLSFVMLYIGSQQ